MLNSVNLKIADTVIRMQSGFPIKPLSEEDLKLESPERFNSFFYKGGRKPDILIDIKVVKKLPKFSGKVIFITTHFQDGSENWRLLKRGSAYIYKSPLDEKKQVAVVSKDFKRADVYLLPKRSKDFVWETSDIIYDFLQVLLINYFAFHKKGIFTHSAGIRDIDDRGYLFNGKSGAGKSTTARIWYKHSKAKVLNDDRIIIRKMKGKFFIYGSPWHGDFSDYLVSRSDSALLDKIFFIHHAKLNRVQPIEESEAFSLLYPNLFPTFWDKSCLENIVSFSLDLIKNIRCLKMGFVNNKNIISFIRKQKGGLSNV